MRYIAASRRFVADYGLGPELDPAALVGRSHYDLFPEIPERWREIHRRVLAGETMSAEEDRFPREDGHVDWVRWEMAPWHDPDGAIGGALLLTDVVTARKEAEAALRESEERLRMFVVGTKDYAFSMLDPEGRIVSWNEGARRIMGYEAAEVVGRHFSLFHGSDDIAANKAHGELQVALRDGKFEEEGEQVRKDGSRIWLNVLITPLTDEAGNLKGFSKIDRDISERKRAEQELAVVTGRLHATIQTAIDAIVVIDEGGIVQSVNPAVERIFGYRTDEVVGKNVAVLMPELDRSTHDSHIAAYLRTGVAGIIGIGREVEGQRTDGSVFPVDLAVAEWTMGGRRFFTGIMRDISARKQAEEQVQFVMRELSHRTRNLLAVVQSMAWKTARTSIDLADFEERFAKRVDALACSHDLLTKKEWRGVRVHDLVQGQLHAFAAENQVDAHGPDLVLTPESAQSLGLALHELATNAVKHGALSCPSGRIEVAWSADSGHAAERQFCMSWRESGGPETKPPERKGFGYAVIKEMTERALTGQVAIEFRPAGFAWRVAALASDCLVEPAE
jgi:PAS domain S-box-containing protein